jgi:6-phosphogluconolactonase
MPAQPKINIFEDLDQLSLYIAKGLKDIPHIKEKVSIVLSGGNTPQYIFNFIVNSDYKKTIKWNRIHFFWSDERCVPPEHPESNYGMTQNLLLRHIPIPQKNIHRIQGEFEPLEEAKEYSNEIIKNVNIKNGIPCFDWIILGMGTDGHTASIFPDSIKIFNSEKLCEVTQHPVTKQNRITLTGKVLNNAERTTFIITGKEKSVIVDSIINKKPGYEKYPAGLVNPDFGILEWVLDRDAGITELTQ